MRRPARTFFRNWTLIGCAAVAVCAAGLALSAAAPSGATAPIFGITIPAGYRDWKLVSVAHEAGTLNDIRAILGNDLAIKTYRQGKTPFPDGTIIARIAWAYVSSEENNKVFGRDQSFVAGAPTEWYLQLMVKDSKKYPGTHGWGFAQFDKDGKPADEAKTKPACPVTSQPARMTSYLRITRPERLVGRMEPQGPSSL
jgi:hypothetical protein